MTTFLLTFLYLITVVLLGFFASRWFMDREEPTSAEIWLPISFGLGLGIQAICHLISMVLFGQVHLAVFWTVFVALGVWFAWDVQRGYPMANYGPFHFLGERSRAVGLYFMGWMTALFFVTVMFYNAMDYPMASYDGRAIWNYKAKILFHERTVFSESFLDQYRIHYHPDYPILVPLSQFSFYNFLGHVDEDQVRFMFSAIMVFFGLYIFGTVSAVSNRWMGLFFMLLFAGAPFRPHWVIRDGGAINSGESDFPLAFLSMIAVLGYYHWWQTGKRHHLLLGAVFCGFALMTKKEGLVVFTMLAGVNGLQWLFGKGGPSRAALKSLAIAAGLSLLVALPWFLVGRHLKNIYDEDYFSNFNLEHMVVSPVRLPVIYAIFMNDVTEVEKWNYSWFLYLPVLLLGIPAWFRRRNFYLDAVVIVWLTGYLVVYFLSPLNLIFHLNTSLRRLLAHLFPIVLLQMAFTIARPQERLWWLVGGEKEGEGTKAKDEG